MKRILLGAAALTLFGLSCAPAQRASLQSLQHRAYFDLACPSHQIRVFRIDQRTTAVMGCGRRLVYLERCDATLDSRSACSWTLDTPTPPQLAWPPTSLATTSVGNPPSHHSAQADSTSRWAVSPQGRASAPTRTTPDQASPRKRAAPGTPRPSFGLSPASRPARQPIELDLGF